MREGEVGRGRRKGLCREKERQVDGEAGWMADGRTDRMSSSSAPGARCARPPVHCVAGLVPRVGMKRPREAVEKCVSVHREMETGLVREVRENCAR
jgi:hypothetical protein